MKGNKLNHRIVLSFVLVFLGIVVAFVPYKDNRAGQLKPAVLLEKTIQGRQFITVDDAARFLINEDSTVRFIDLRSPQEYRAFNIPGSVNIPYEDLLNRDWEGYLHQDKVRNILYSNGDLKAGLAWTLTARMGYGNNYIMKGGMNEWYRTVMKSHFSGGRITPSQNAVFEARRKASILFTNMNSLPDSLKVKYLEAKRLEEAKLTGGCE